MEGESHEVATASAKAPRPGERLASFLAARGRRVVEGAGALWAEYRRPFFESLPIERRFEPDPGALARMMRAERVLAVRYPSASGAGLPSGIFACAVATYSKELVERRHRRQIRKGFENCAMRAIDPDELLALGLELNLDTMGRQRRSDPEFGTTAGWRRFVRAVRDSPDVFAWGAFAGGRLSSYELACRDGAWLHNLYKMSRTEHRGLHGSVALDYWVVAEAARGLGVDWVSNGFLSVMPGADGLHRYKQDLGYSLVPMSFGVRFHPLARPALTSRFAVAAARGAARLARRHPQVELASRVLRGARDTASADR
jgi:hypothetical protein